MLKIGLLGAGHLGKIHLRLLKNIPHYELVGFYDTDPETTRIVEAETGLKGWSSLDRLIDACDVVDITTPTLNHFDGASRALKKSKHVFIEKPLTTTLVEAKSLMRLAEEARVKVQIGHVERFNPAFLAAQAQLINPLFIETHRLAQFNPRGTDVSVVHDLMIHDIDIVLSLIKANIRRISASGVAIVSETPDMANARIEFDNGAVANLTASRISLKNMRKSRFFCSDRYISVDFLEKQVRVASLQDGLAADQASFHLDLGEGREPKHILLQAPEVQPINAIQMELESFATAILNNSRPAVPIDDGYAALEVANKIVEQLEWNANFAARTINEH